MEYENFPDYYQRYVWEGKHKLFGYPSDSYPDFKWIKSLEDRFIWLKENYEINHTASIYLIKEMIEWGGSQNGVLQKFNDGCGEVNLYELIDHIAVNIDSPEDAITCALNMPGLGLTYASKLLRFMGPDTYGALDSRIRKALLDNNLLTRIYDGNATSMVRGYLEFLILLNNIKHELESRNINKPACALSGSCSWKPAEIEMALFCWAEDN